MKRIVYIMVGFATIVAAFWFLSPSRVAAQTTTNNTSEAQYQRALDEQTARAKRYTDLLRSQEEIHQRAAALVVKQEQLMTRQEADFSKFEKILDTWERQQKQYQRYLDSLTK